VIIKVFISVSFGRISSSLNVYQNIYQLFASAALKIDVTLMKWPVEALKNIEMKHVFI